MMAAYGYSDIKYISEGGGKVENKTLGGFCQYGVKSYTVPYGVERIEDGFFEGRNGIETIVLPNSLQSIPANCFKGCSELKTIVIPSSVREIGNSAFAGCKKLNSISIPSSVTRIGNYAFQECENLERVTLSNSLSEISASAFYGCSRLTSISFPEPINRIGAYAFYGCSSLATISFPLKLKEIGRSAFASCENLKSITLPPSVTEIGESAFSSCSSLESVTLPRSLTRISESLFWFCKSLTSVSLPERVEEIGVNAFYNCTQLKFVSLPKSLRIIERNAFCSCSNLTSILLPDSLTTIGEGAFSLCWSLSAITIGNHVSTVGQRAFPSQIKRVYLPRNANRVGDDAFPGANVSRECSYGAAVADDVVIAEGTLTIPPHTFDRTGIKTVSLPDSVVEIGEYAFANCEDIRILHMPSRLRSIGSHAFSHCEPVQITLPSSIVRCALDAFSEGCVVTINGIDIELKFKTAEFEQDSCKEEDAINAKKQKIKAIEQEILDKKERVKKVEAIIGEKEAVLVEEQKRVPDAKKALEDAKQKLSEVIGNGKRTITEIEEELSVVEGAKRQLETEYKDTFFLNLSKRSSISQAIEAKQQEINALKERLSAEKAQFDELIQSLESDMASAKAGYQSIDNSCFELRRQITELRKTNETNENEISNLAHGLIELRNILETDEKEHQKRNLERERQLELIRQAAAFRASALERTLLEKQKDSILSSVNSSLQSALKRRAAVPPAKHLNPDETLLNDSFRRIVNQENERKMAEWRTQYLSDNQKKVDKLRGINRKLSLDENDGIDLLLTSGTVDEEWTNKDFPKRIVSICKLFESEDLWDKLKKQVKGKKHKWTDPFHKKLFEGRDYALLQCDKKATLVFLPYCAIGYGPKSDMVQLFYDAIHVSVECNEFESETTQKDCEEIGNRYLHANKDGSRNMRFSDNPLIHLWRKSTVIIKAGSEKYSYSVARKSEAEEIKSIIDSYSGVLGSSTYKDTYLAIKVFRTIEEIKDIFENSKSHLEKQADLEKERRIAERQKAEQEAEEKRRKLIAKQRERNTEKRFDEISASQTETSEEMLTWQPAHEEKKRENVDAGLKAYPAVAEAILDQTYVSSEQPQDGLILDSNVRTVHNNIFSLDFSFRGDAKSRAQGRSVFMCDAFGNVISDISTVQIENKKKLRLTMTLKQNSFSKKEKYYLAVVNDANGEVESITEFKIDIAFSNIFDDGFGF